MQTGSIQELGTLVRDLSKRTKKLRDASALIGTKQDTKTLRQQIQQDREGCMQLSKRVSDVLRTKPPSRAEKVNHEKLLKEFEAVFADFERINKATLEKERLIVDVIHETLQDEEYRRTGALIAPEDPTRASQVMMFKELGDFDELALKEREADIRQLEKDMKEASTLFKDVAQMVNDQGAMLGEAEQHVTVAVVETEKAVDELGKVSGR